MKRLIHNIRQKTPQPDRPVKYLDSFVFPFDVSEAGH